MSDTKKKVIIDSSDGGLYANIDQTIALPTFIGPFEDRAEAETWLRTTYPDGLWGSYQLGVLNHPDKSKVGAGAVRGQGL